MYFCSPEDPLQSHSCPRVPAVKLFQYIEVCLCAHENKDLQLLHQDRWVGQCTLVEGVSTDELRAVEHTLSTNSAQHTQVMLALGSLRYMDQAHR
jgi:hypothetical protein